jgi:uncharacterized protein Yka (UPF0111/DUF47 family)
MSKQDSKVPQVVREQTELLLAEIGQCIELLPKLIDIYGRDHARFTKVVGELRERESACNATARDLRLSVGRSVTFESTGLYLMAGDLLSLYTLVETVGNRAETVGTELAAIQPALPDDCRASLLRLAERAITAFEALSSATMTYLVSLLKEDDSADAIDSIERVRSIESGCDELRQATLRMAFEDGPTLDSLALRAVVYDLDSVVNGIETAADRLDVMRSTRI